jgi:ABC-type transport system substrate-binding protein
MTNLLGTIAGTSNSAQLTTMYAQVQTIDAQAATTIPLFQGTAVAVSSPKVTGIVLDVTTIFRYWLLQETT